MISALTEDRFQNCGSHIRVTQSEQREMMLGFSMSLEVLYQGDKRMRTTEKTEKHEKMRPPQGMLHNLVYLLPQEIQGAC